MLVHRTPSWLLAASFSLALLASAIPAAAQSDNTTVKFHDVAYETVTIQVRTGANEEQSLPYGTHVLKKDESWVVSSNLPILWRRELNPGSNDGKYTPWQRVAASGDTTVDLPA
jgi:hypothetical protein